jgi:outer membrane immunogenic protein
MFSTKLLGVVVSVLLLGSAMAVAAEKPEPLPRAEVAVDYSFMRANAGPGTCGCFNLSGGSAEAAVHLWHGFSGVVDVEGEHTGSADTPGQSLSLLFFTAGPRFTYRRPKHERFAPFVQGLVGAVHGFDAPFPTASGVVFSANALAVQVGGGLDIAVRHHVAIRAFQADYAFAHLPNNVNDHQNLLQLSAGLVFRLK